MKKITIVVVLILLSIATSKLWASDSTRVVRFEKGRQSGTLRKIEPRSEEKFDTVTVKIDPSVPDSITNEQILEILNSDEGMLDIGRKKTSIEYGDYFFNYKVKYNISYIYIYGDVLKFGTKPEYEEFKSWYLIFALISIIFMVISNLAYFKNIKFFAAVFAAASALVTFAASVAIALIADLIIVDVALTVAFASTFVDFVAAFAALSTLKKKKRYIFSSIVFYVLMITFIILSIIGI